MAGLRRTIRKRLTVIEADDPASGRREATEAREDFLPFETAN